MALPRPFTRIEDAAAVAYQDDQDLHEALGDERAAWEGEPPYDAAAADDLARCIEDAALLAEARRLAAEADHWCPGCKGYLTDVALCTLLDLLTEETTNG